MTPLTARRGLQAAACHRRCAQFREPCPLITPWFGKRMVFARPMSSELVTGSEVWTTRVHEPTAPSTFNIAYSVLELKSPGFDHASRPASGNGIFGHHDGSSKTFAARKAALRRRPNQWSSLHVRNCRPICLVHQSDGRSQRPCIEVFEFFKPWTFGKFGETISQGLKNVLGSVCDWRQERGAECRRVTSLRASACARQAVSAIAPATH